MARVDDTAAEPLGSQEAALTQWVSNQTVLITGGGSGLGRALVQRFTEEGANVGVLERSAEKSAALNSDFSDVVVTTGDASLLSDNVRAVEAVVNRFGALDCIIGNAAIWDFSTSLFDLPSDRIEQAFDELFAINVKGYLLGAKAALPHLIASSGSMIFSLSNATFYPSGGGPLYTASKHAAAGLVRQLAYELAPKIRVNGVAPSGMATDLRGPAALEMADRRMMDQRSPEELAAIFPLGFMPEPSDYTGHYVLLASRDQSRTTTGALIQADMGLGIRGLRRPSGGSDL